MPSSKYLKHWTLEQYGLRGIECVKEIGTAYVAWNVLKCDLFLWSNFFFLMLKKRLKFHLFLSLFH